MKRFRHHGVRQVADVATALAGGLAMLDSAATGGPVEAVWWTPRRPALVLGRGSAVSEQAEATSAREIDIVRRSSGGGPVLWDGSMLALDLVVPREHHRFADDVTASYEWIGRAVAAAIGRLGPDARALTVDEARRTDAPAAARLACFAGRSPWEVVVDGRKLVGLSQTRRRQGALIQVGILGTVDGAALPALLDVTADEAKMLSTALERSAIGLTDLGLNAPAAVGALDAAIAAAAA